MAYLHHRAFWRRCLEGITVWNWGRLRQNPNAGLLALLPTGKSGNVGHQQVFPVLFLYPGIIQIKLLCHLLPHLEPDLGGLKVALMGQNRQLRIYQTEVIVGWHKVGAIFQHLFLRSTSGIILALL